MFSKKFILILFLALFTIYFSGCGSDQQEKIQDSLTKDSAGIVTVAAITPDDVINSTEAGETIIVSGIASGGAISEGDAVKLAINEIDYYAVVAKDGSWNTLVSGSDLVADTEFTVSVQSMDSNNNPVITTAISTHTVDATASSGVINIAPITPDNIINARESKGPISVHGIAIGSDIASGDFVVFTVNNVEYNATIKHNGSWATDVSGADLITSTELTVNINSTELIADNNVTETTRAPKRPVGKSSKTKYIVDTMATAGTVTVAPITADDIINGSESTQAVIVSGVAIGGDISSGDIVTFTINGTNYSTTVEADGSWKTGVAGSDLAADTEFTVNVESSDDAGNSVTSSATSTHTVDTTAEAGTITVSPITTDNVINSKEYTQIITVTGIAIGGDISTGDTVTFNANGTNYTSTVNENGSWSVNVAGSDLAAQTEFTVKVSSRDTSLNQVTSTATSAYIIDTVANAGTVTVASITTDDVINKAESTQVILVSGTAKGGDISTGDSVNFTVNGTNYISTVGADGSWSVNVKGSDLIVQTMFTVNVESSDNYFNSVTSTAVSTHIVDITANAGTVTVAPITLDDVINKAESTQTIVVSGTAKGGDISTGDAVTFNVNGTDYATTVGTDGRWSVNVASIDLVNDTEFTVIVTSSDIYLNTVTSIVTSIHIVDVVANAGTVTVAPITADNVINSYEATQEVAVSGTAIGGDISSGDAVTFNVNGTDYSATVGTDGSWSVNVAGSDLVNATQFSVNVNVNSYDTYLNTVISTTNITYKVDTTATSGTVTVAPITADNVINASEATQTIAVSGTAIGGDISSGDAVTFTVNGTDYATTVGTDGGWSVNVAGSDLLITTEFTISVQSKDIYENEVTSLATSIHTTGISATPGIVTVANITADDLINKSESTQSITVSGIAIGGDISTGDAVTFTVNGTNYSSTVGADGSWSTNVAGSDLALDTEFIVNVVSTNKSGTSVTSTTNSIHTVDMTANAGTVTVAPITADNIINKSESTKLILVSGTAIGGDISTGDAVTFTVNGTNYSSTVGADGSWSTNVSGSDLALDTEFIVNVASKDAYSNQITSTTTSTYIVDTVLASGTLTVNNITADDIINATEATNAIIVSGTATCEDVITYYNVAFNINGTIYYAKLQPDGTWKTFVAGSDLAAVTEFNLWLNYVDASGNGGSLKAISTHTVDLTAYAGTVTVAPITADNIINSSESTQTILVSGTATGGDISSGDAVTFNVNGTNYTSTVAADGRWNTNVAGSDLAAQTQFMVTVTSKDSASNAITSTTVSTYTVDILSDNNSTTTTKTFSGIIGSSILDINTTYTGIIVNASVVQGLEYTCDNQKYTTAQYGTLNCDIFPISFNIGNLELGSVSNINSDSMIYLQDIFDLPRGGTMHPEVTNISLLLQSLDEDADLSTGINISPETIDLINTYFPASVEFSTIPYTELLFAIDSIITDRALQTNPVQLSLVPMVDAQDNLTKRMANPFVVQ